MNCKMQLAFIKCKQIKEAHFNEHNLNVMTSESKYINISNYHTETTFQLECILRKNVFDKRWVSIFSTLTKFEQHLCLQIDEMSNFTCYLQSLVPGKVYVQNMYITIHK